MMRTLYSGILGLNAHQAEMDVIGNNVANVNTFGYKKERVVFQDILSQTIGFSSAPTEESGGINSKQVGLGVSLAAIDNIFTQGAMQTTGRANDVAIEGEGFFVVKDGERQLYTRVGTFDVDGDSNIVHSGDGNILQGWAAYEDPYTKDVSVDETKAI
jgi:flagellar hook protein FlgE